MSRVSAFTGRPPSRPPSEQLCELHVYKVPMDLWRSPLNNILNQSVTDTVSLGIIRVPPDLNLIDIRGEIDRQLEELAPRDYVFLRSVGRSITRLKPKQEYQLKAKHFLPPQSYAPELYILEATPEIRAALAASDRSSQQSPTSPQHGSPGSRTYRNGYRSDRERNGYPDHGSPRHSPDPRKGMAGQTYRAANGYERDAAYTNRTNEDSGVAGFTPEDQYKNRGKENFYDALNSKSRDFHNRLNRDGINMDDEEEARRRLQELEDGSRMDDDRWSKDQEERRRRAEEERHRTEEERKREEDRKRAEEEEERRRQEEQRRREEDEEKRRRQEEEARLKANSEEELNRFPSPPPQHMSSRDMQRDTESARQRRREEQQKLLAELEEARQTRQVTEKEREELVKKAKTLQTKTQNRRNQARDIWKKRYFEEKKRTPPLEEQTNRLKEELEVLHRKLMAVLEGPKEKSLKIGDNKPSKKSNYVIQCTRLQHEIDDMKRRIENAKMKLTAEMKLRNQAEAELRSLRAELIQKKINMSLVRSQQFAALNPGMNESTPVPEIPPGKGDAQSIAA